MWRTPDCRLPNDDKRLALMVGYTNYRWKKKKDTILAFFSISDDGQFLVQKRLQKERSFVTKTIEQKRKAGRKSAEARALKNNNTGSTAVPTAVPTAGSTDGQQPIPTPIPRPISGGGGSAEPVPIRIRIMTAAGMQDCTTSGRLNGNHSDMLQVEKWRELGLTDDEIVSVVEEVSQGRPPASSFSYFTQPMQRYAGEKSAPALKPIEGQANAPFRGSFKQTDDTADRIRRLAERGATLRPPSELDHGDG